MSERLTCKIIFSLQESEYPKVLLAIFISKPTPFLEEFFQRVEHQKYPKEKIDLFVYNNVKYHEPMVEEFIDKYGQKYKSVKQIKPVDEIVEPHAKSLAM